MGEWTTEPTASLKRHMDLLRPIVQQFDAGDGLLWTKFEDSMSIQRCGRDVVEPNRHGHTEELQYRGMSDGGIDKYVKQRIANLKMNNNLSRRRVQYLQLLGDGARYCATLTPAQLSFVRTHYSHLDARQLGKLQEKIQKLGSV